MEVSAQAQLARKAVVKDPISLDRSLSHLACLTSQCIVELSIGMACLSCVIDDVERGWKNPQISLSRRRIREDVPPC